MNGPSNGRPYGLRLTMRHQMILVVYCAAAFAFLSASGRGPSPRPFGDALTLVWLASPWCLGLLVMTLDRPGPVRNWASLVLLMLFAPALAFYHDATVIADLLAGRPWPNPAATLCYNALFLGSFAAFWWLMGPAQCPECSRRALVPLMRLWGQTKRTQNTRWCAACGQLLWRHTGGDWRPERRMTWLDGAANPLSFPAEVARPVETPSTMRPHPSAVVDRVGEGAC